MEDVDGNSDLPRRVPKKRPYAMMTFVVLILIVILMYGWTLFYHNSSDFILLCNDDVSKINQKIDSSGKISSSDDLVTKAINDGCIHVIEGNGFDGYITTKLVVK